MWQYCYWTPQSVSVYWVWEPINKPQAQLLPAVVTFTIILHVVLVADHTVLTGWFIAGGVVCHVAEKKPPEETEWGSEWVGETAGDIFLSWVIRVCVCVAVWSVSLSIYDSDRIKFLIHAEVHVQTHRLIYEPNKFTCGCTRPQRSCTHNKYTRL